MGEEGKGESEVKMSRRGRRKKREKTETNRPLDLLQELLSELLILCGFKKNKQTNKNKT